MPDTPSTINSDVLAALHRNDESALERLFRGEYATLIAEATTLLEDGPSAAAAVERAFLRVWDERESFKTPQDLDTFLRQTVHSAALRQKSRREALHHSLAHEHKSQGAAHARGAAAPSVDAGWTQVVARLHPSAEKSDEAARQVAAITRHDASEKLSAMAKPKSRFSVVGIVLGIVVVAGAAWGIERMAARGATDAALNAADVHLLQTPPGKMADITLLDGSTVRLAPGTTIKVPSIFPDKLRALRLEGAAMFKVDPASKIPFDLRTANAAIVATGTAFSVRAYPTESVVTVRVTEGSVSVKSAKETRTLAAGAALAIDKDGTMHEPEASALDEAMGWTDGHLTIHQRPLREVLKDFDLWYGVHLVPTDSAILTRPVSLRASLDSVAKAINAMESSAKVRFAYDGPRMIVSDAAGGKKQ